MSRNFSKRYILFVAAFLLCGAAARANTILDYVTPLTSTARVEVPQTAFHDWQVAQDDANLVIQQWQTAPVGIPWTRIQLDHYIKHKVAPSRGARGLALLHVAIHDALSLANEKKLDGRLAVSMAAARVLGYQFSTEERAFDRVAYSIAAQISQSQRDQLPPAAIRALQLGLLVGERVVAHAESDGAQRGWNGSRLQWYGDGRYFGPGTWEPTPPYFYYPPDEPFAPSWKTWVLKNASQFRPTPPAFGSRKFLHDLQEVIAINQSLSEAQLATAKFWVDGHGSVTPPGHWNQIAIDYALRFKLDDVKAARLFADLNIALADTFIAAWDCKYHYWTIRPVTAAKKVLNTNLVPPILTPPFPSYVSGHAASSGAAATVLSAYFPKQKKALNAMAEEAAMSRLYGGIHYRHDNDDGLILGQNVAEFVLKFFESH